MQYYAVAYQQFEYNLARALCLATVQNRPLQFTTRLAVRVHKCAVFVELHQLTLCLISLSFSHAGTVDTGGGGEGTQGSHSTHPAHQHAGDKRRSAENCSDEPAAKKSSKVTQPLKKPGIAFSLSGTKVETAKKPAPPIKLKLGERVIIRILCSKPKNFPFLNTLYFNDNMYFA